MSVLDRMAELVRDAAGVMLERADELGVTRKAIAMKAGIEYGTLANYSHASKEQTMPATRAMQLLMAEYIPVQARLDALNAALKFTPFRVCVEDGAIDRAAPVVQLADIMTCVGKLSEAIASATRRESDGGRAVTGTELDAMLKATGAAVAELVELERALREKRKGAVG